MIYFTAHTCNCVCHCIKAMFIVLGMYNFGQIWKNIAAGHFYGLVRCKYLKKFAPRCKTHIHTHWSLAMCKKGS